MLRALASAACLIACATTPARADRFSLEYDGYALGLAPITAAPQPVNTLINYTASATYGLNPDRIVCGAGSDDLLFLMAHGFIGMCESRAVERSRSETP